MPNVQTAATINANYVAKFASATTVNNSGIYDAGGTIGIGTTALTPGIRLDVAGVIKMTGLQLFENPVLGYVLTCTDATSGKATWKPAGIGGSGTANFLPKFNAANSVVNSVVSESGGNVVIGTTPGSAKLDVNGTTRLGGTIPNPGVYVDGNTGNVGLGTAAPSQKLDVNGNINITGSVQALQSMLAFSGLTARSSSAATPAGVFDNTAAGKILSGQTSGLEKFSVDASGNVMASGTAQVNGLKLPSGASNGYVLTSDPSGNATWLPPALGGTIGGTGTPNAFPMFTAATMIGDSPVYECNSKIGIGIDLPQEELTLAQDSNLATEMQIPINITYGFQTSGGLPADDYYFVLAASDGLGWTKGTMEILVVLGATDHTISLHWDAVVGATNYRVYRALTPGGPYKYIETTATNFDYLGDSQFNTVGAPPTATTAYINKLSAAGNSWLLGGKVGIGTTNPQAKLDVSGDLRLQAGPAIREFSTDQTLSDDSDSAVPTERAVKEYIDNLFVGSIAAFAMEQPPDGWLECNGQALDRTVYARLFSRIGTTFGKGDSATTFNIPDLRGRFVRGWSHGSGEDPDRNSRTEMASGGATGDRVGSKQGDQFAAHAHTFEYKIDSYAVWPGVEQSNLRGTGNQAVTNPCGNIETRPKNVYLNYCIKF